MSWCCAAKCPAARPPASTGLAERTARNVLADLIKDGIVASDTPKSSVYLRFPVHAVDVLFPRLFPEA